MSIPRRVAADTDALRSARRGRRSGMVRPRTPSMVFAEVANSIEDPSASPTAPPNKHPTNRDALGWGGAGRVSAKRCTYRS